MSKKAQNKQLDNDLMNWYKLLAISIIKYENLPEGLTSQRIEKYLFENGNVLFFEDSTLGFMTLPPASYGINYYSEPINFQITAPNYSAKYTIDNAVLIKNNALGLPTRALIENDIRVLSSIEETAVFNLDLQRLKVLFRVNSRAEELTLKTLLARLSNLELTYLVKDGNPSQEFLNINNDIPLLANDLDTAYNVREARLLTKLGLDNNSVIKRERLVSSEAEKNEDVVDSALNILLDSRQDAINKINEMFGLNIKPVVNYGVIEKMKEITNEEVLQDDITANA